MNVRDNVGADNIKEEKALDPTELTDMCSLRIFFSDHLMKWFRTCGYVTLLQHSPKTIRKHRFYITIHNSSQSIVMKP